MKIIFLDIDGVLNNSLEADEHKDVFLNGNYQGFYSPRCVEHLNEITRRTGAVIVLSSTWRLDLSVNEINQMFEIMGIDAPCVGKTDFLIQKWVFRGNEILKYLQDNNLEYHRNYVILDDDTDMLMWQTKNYVNCDPCIGLSDRVVSKAVAILNNSICEDTGQEFSPI